MEGRRRLRAVARRGKKFENLDHIVGANEDNVIIGKCTKKRGVLMAYRVPTLTVKASLAVIAAPRDT